MNSALEFSKRGVPALPGSFFWCAIPPKSRRSADRANYGEVPGYLHAPGSRENTPGSRNALFSSPAAKRQIPRQAPWRNLCLRNTKQPQSFSRNQKKAAVPNLGSGAQKALEGGGPARSVRWGASATAWLGSIPARRLSAVPGPPHQEEPVGSWGALGSKPLKSDSKAPQTRPCHAPSPCTSHTRPITPFQTHPMPCLDFEHPALCNLPVPQTLPSPSITFRYYRPKHDPPDRYLGGGGGEQR